MILQEQSIIENLKPHLPKIKQWIDNLILPSTPRAKNISTFGFKRLPSYFSEGIMQNTKVVVVTKMPTIPLSQLGLSQFGQFESLDPIGIVYLDTVFIREGSQNEESLFFHELIHIMQWKMLGADDFILAYGLGLFLHPDDYSKSFLERMAFENQAIFLKENTPFDVERKLKAQMEDHKIFIESLKGSPQGV